MQKTPHLLVIRLSAMGDVAMTVPVLKAFVNQHPNVKVTVLSKPFLQPLFAQIPNVHFYKADVKNKHKGILGLYKLFKELKALGVTQIADLHNVLRSKIIRSFFFLAGKKVAFINKGRKEKKALTRVKNKIFKPLKTTHQRYADVFQKLGYKVDISQPKFDDPQKMTSKIKEIAGEKNKKWVGIAPFAQYQSKTYPLDVMEKVISSLNNSNHCKIFLFGGGEKEKNHLEIFSKKYVNAINMVGKITLYEELILISNLDVMLSMDSGNGHFSAMYGVPTVTLWGATHPYAGFMPFAQPAGNALLPDLKKYPNLPCSIYGNKVCHGYNDVMRTILPQKVIEKVQQILGKK